MALAYLQQYGSTSEGELEPEDVISNMSSRKMRKRDAAVLEAKNKKRSIHPVIFESCAECHLHCGIKIAR